MGIMWGFWLRGIYNLWIFGNSKTAAFTIWAVLFSLFLRERERERKRVGYEEKQEGRGFVLEGPLILYHGTKKKKTDRSRLSAWLLGHFV